MLKARTGTDRSLQSVMWASTATLEELFTENRVVSPFGSLRSTSKYGSSSVAAGATSTLQSAADAGTAEAITRKEKTPRNTRFFISHLLQVWPQGMVWFGAQALSSRRPSKPTLKWPLESMS